MIRKVLIVEDLPHVLKWVQTATKAAFPEACIQSSDNLVEAQKLVKHHCFDLVLLDIGLPDGSGLDLIPQVLEKLPSCLIVMSTLFDDDVHVFKALRLGAKGYVLKDESKAELSTMLKNIEQGHQPISPSIANKLLGFFTPLPQHEKLTPRELEVLTSVAKGFNVPQTAKMLSITNNTCYGYVKSIYQKLKISSRAEAALEATRLGLVNPNN